MLVILLAPGGRMITIAIDAKAPVAALLYVAASTVFGSRRVRFFSANFSAEILNDLGRYVETGAIRPVVDNVYLRRPALRSQQSKCLLP